MSTEKSVKADELASLLGGVSLLDALRERRSRRFGLGMSHDVGPMKYKSAHPPMPLSETEEAALAFAACGITGHALAELVYHEGQGGTMMGSFLGRTVGSPDAVHAVTMVVTNDDATYLLKRPQDFEPSEIPEIIELTRNGALTELYRKSRIKLRDGRTAPPLDQPFNIDCNQWDLYAPGTTYFVPINEYGYMYINLLLEILSDTMQLFLVDDRAGFRPAGLAPFARSKGGHLEDNLDAQRTMTIERIETTIHSVIMVEQGMMLQNLYLMCQAMGLGGFPNYAGHEFAWLRELGFTMGSMPTLRYLGAGKLTQMGASLLGKNPPLPYALGLEKDGKVLMKPYCPPYYASMEEAVMAVVERKFGSKRGIFRGGIETSGFRDPKSVAEAAPAIPQQNIDATIAYCNYVYDTYGRFPSYPACYRTNVGFQAAHLDLDYYERFYRPEAVSATHREHMARWHGA